jgi:Glycosyl hydrolase family 1
VTAFNLIQRCHSEPPVILRRIRRIWNDPGLDNDYGEIYRIGLYRVLKSVYQRTRGNKPLYITENGFSDAIDDRRPRAIPEPLAMMHRAIRDGIAVRGYLHWSLVDNFEWTGVGVPALACLVKSAVSMQLQKISSHVMRPRQWMLFLDSNSTYRLRNTSNRLSLSGKSEGESITSI